RFDLLVEQHLNVHQSQRDQTPDQLHLRVRLQSLVLLAPQHPDLAQTPLAPPHASYDTAHRRLLSSEVSGRLSTPSHHSGWSRFNFQLMISHLPPSLPLRIRRAEVVRQNEAQDRSATVEDSLEHDC